MERKIGLDIVRATAIVIVVLGHTTSLLVGTTLESFPYGKPVDGVDLFFVLSGFLIGGILLKDFDAKPTIFTVLHFWKRRWFRTLPLYYLFLVINYIFISNKWILGDINSFSWKFLFFVQNFSSPFYDFFWESWSLSIEEWFYLFFPLIFLLLMKITSMKRAYFIGAITMIVLSLCFRFYYRTLEIDAFFFDNIFKKIVLLRLDSIAFGLLTVWLIHYYSEQLRKLRFLFLLICILILVYQRTIVLDYSSFEAQVLYYSISPVALSLTLPYFYFLNLKRNRFTAIFTFISQISYSMYLINLSVVDVINSNFSRDYGIFNYLVSWILIIGMSYVIYKYFEKPITNLRDSKLFLSTNKRTSQK